MKDGADIPVLVIFGPTASGKTALSSTLFVSGLSEQLTGKAEIISADSRQVYRFLNIGTAKSEPSFLEKLPHHLIDICDPAEQFCAGDFVRLADKECEDIISRGKFPVVLGGTAFYIRNFLYGLPETPSSDPEVRISLHKRMNAEGAQTLFRELERVDPVRASQIHPNDEYRIIRALEVFIASGKPPSAFELCTKHRKGFRFLVISLDRKREELYRRIDARVKEMFSAGLLKEFEYLLASGYNQNDPGMLSIGYREFFALNEDRTNLGDICLQIQKDSRKYAKRQETFIRSLPDIVHFHADDIPSILSAVLSFYYSKT